MGKSWDGGGGGGRGGRRSNVKWRSLVDNMVKVVDLKQSTPEHLRLRSNILPDSATYQYAYIPKI